MSGVEKKDPESSEKEAQEVSPAEAIPFKDKESAAPQEVVGLHRSSASTSGTIGQWQGRHLLKLFPPLGPADFPKLRTKIHDEDYPIQSARRGQCIIFNYKGFQPHTHSKKGMLPDWMEDEDVDELSHRFAERGFYVITYSRLTRDETLRVLQQRGHDDYTQYDCFVCWILTPAQNGDVYTDNGDVLTVEHFVGPFCENQGLLGKPKLFFIQACSGGRVEEVETIVGIRARHALPPRVPADADVLVACSTVPSYFSRGNGLSGSLFVQAFCCMLETSTGSEDLITMLMEVYRVVALSYEVCNRSQHYTYGTRQMPYVTSTLTRSVRFPRVRQHEEGPTHFRDSGEGFHLV